MKGQTPLSGFVKAIAVFSTLATAVPHARQCNWTVGQTVSTTNGDVIGHAASDALEVSEYLGIPFAQPPTGSLRFQPPVAYEGSSTYNASDFSPSCMQASGGSTDGQSEDCLTINVWTKPQTGETKKAVLVWIYGGAYTSGSSNQPGYNGKYIADQEDVVLVSLNYRLNIFGFPGNPATPANLGLMDMRLAMEWIRDNIESFGGDVDRISIFGQSAGAGMTDFYSYAWAEDPIANGFILMSATANGFPALSNDTQTPRWFRIAANLGCNSTDADEVTACMQTKTSAQIVGAFGPEEIAVRAVPSFGPTADNVIVWANYTGHHAATGGYLIGNTENEAGLFRSFTPGRSEAFWSDFNNRYYTCADRVRIDQAVADGNPAWRYRYFGDFPNLAVSMNPPSGAYHAADLPPLFDTVSQTPIPSTPEEVAVGDYNRGAWAAFAKNTSAGLLTYADGWPMYAPAELTLVRLAYENRTGTNLALGNAYDAVCATLPAMPPTS